MKEVLTKSFWQGVKKTFDEARENRPVETAAPQKARDSHNEPAAAEESATPPEVPDPGPRSPA